jgi:hypothetical protein
LESLAPHVARTVAEFHHRVGAQPSTELTPGTGSERITPPTLLTSSSPFEPETASTVPFAA